MPALFRTDIKIHALDPIRLIPEEGAQGLAQPGIQHPGQAGGMVQAAADQATPVVRLALRIAFDAGAPRLQIHHVLDKAIALVAGKAAFDQRIAIALVLFPVTRRYFQLHSILVSTAARRLPIVRLGAVWREIPLIRPPPERPPVRRRWPRPRGRCRRFCSRAPRPGPDRLGRSSPPARPVRARDRR